uniref:Uncharacterized protein n=1 Tax=Sphaerodactylus townsendi TaxID=933632 RepID=A0ACB8EF20_9SAUR
MMAVLEASEPDISTNVATLLSTYKIPQVSHGSHLAVLNDKTQFPFFYQMAPREEVHYLGIVKLLLHFRWTWVGLLASDNDDGEKFRNTLTALMLNSSICAAFSRSIPDAGVMASLRSEEKYLNLASFFKQGHLNAIIFYGHILDMLTLEIVIQIIHEATQVAVGKVWITALLLDPLFSLMCDNPSKYITVHGSLSIMSQTKKGRMYPYAEMCKPLIQEFLEKSFDPFYSKPVWSVRGHLRYTEKERQEAGPWEALKEHLPLRAYNIYTSIQAVAHTISAAYSSRSAQRMRISGGGLEHSQIQPWQLHPHLRHLQFFNSSVGRVRLDENGDLQTDVDIVNVVIWRNRSTSTVKVGSLERQASGVINLTIDQDAIVWPTWYKQVGKMH